MTHKNYDKKLPDPVQAAKDTAEYGVISITNSNASPEEFAEWLIKEGKKLKDWSKDSLYDEFLLTYVKNILDILIFFKLYFCFRNKFFCRS